MDNLIKEYIKNLDEYTIDKYSKIYKINLTQEEIKIIYVYIKNYWYEFYNGDPKYIFEELEEQIDEDKLNKIKSLYYKYKKS